MKKIMLITAFAGAIAMFAGPASADVGRTVTATYAFPAIGQGDLGGVCFNQPTDPPELGPLGSCLEATPILGEDHVDVTVTDNSGNPVYVSIQQDNNPNFAAGCGTITNFPVLDSTAGGGPADPVVVFPWPGPGANPSFDTPGVDPCVPGTIDTTGGTATFTFHNHV
ncbi:MAG: hypothetical protein ACRDHM_02135 [Actinomycetota bacterium]